MAIQIFDSNQTVSLSTFSPMRLLQLSRPTTKCKFVRQGDTIHLLVFMNDFSDVPFLRISADSLYRAARSFMSIDHEQS